MDEKKRMKWAVSFPDLKLTAEQELELKRALKSAVVTVLPKLAEGRVQVQPKENDWLEK
jgi:hypothetical protein